MPDIVIATSRPVARLDGYRVLIVPYSETWLRDAVIAFRGVADGVLRAVLWDLDLDVPPRQIHAMRERMRTRVAGVRWLFVGDVTKRTTASTDSRVSGVDRDRYRRAHVVAPEDVPATLGEITWPISEDPAKGGAGVRAAPGPNHVPWERVITEREVPEEPIMASGSDVDAETDEHGVMRTRSADSPLAAPTRSNR